MKVIRVTKPHDKFEPQSVFVCHAPVSPVIFLNCMSELFGETPKHPKKTGNLKSQPEWNILFSCLQTGEQEGHKALPHLLLHNKICS